MNYFKLNLSFNISAIPKMTSHVYYFTRIAPSQSESVKFTNQSESMWNHLWTSPFSEMGKNQFIKSFKACNLISDPDVLNGINWSGDLDEIFKKNRQEFPGIYWQSFGSRNGYLRVYPAARHVLLCITDIL